MSPCESLRQNGRRAPAWQGASGHCPRTASRPGSQRVAPPEVGRVFQRLPAFAPAAGRDGPRSGRGSAKMRPAWREARGGRAGGFSLIELLIVLALLLVMIVLMHGSGSRSRQERDKAGCQKNLHQVYLALELFSNDHGGLFPVVNDAKTSEGPLSLLVPKYTVATESFVCPGGRDSGLPAGEPFARRKISYAYYMGLRAADTGEPLMSDRQINTTPRNRGETLFSTTGQPPGNNHHKYGGNVLFVGGDVKMSRPKAEFDLRPTQTAVLLNPKP